jgi:hypothetical protein
MSRISGKKFLGALIVRKRALRANQRRSKDKKRHRRDPLPRVALHLLFLQRTAFTHNLFPGDDSLAFNTIFQVVATSRPLRKRTAHCNPDQGLSRDPSRILGRGAGEAPPFPTSSLLTSEAIGVTTTLEPQRKVLKPGCRRNRAAHPAATERGAKKATRCGDSAS